MEAADAKHSGSHSHRRRHAATKYTAYQFGEFDVGLFERHGVSFWSEIIFGNLIGVEWVYDYVFTLWWTRPFKLARFALRFMRSGNVWNLKEWRSTEAIRVVAMEMLVPHASCLCGVFLFAAGIIELAIRGACLVAFAIYWFLRKQLFRLLAPSSTGPSGDFPGPGGPGPGPSPKTPKPKIDTEKWSRFLDKIKRDRETESSSSSSSSSDDDSPPPGSSHEGWGSGFGPHTPAHQIISSEGKYFVTPGGTCRLISNRIEDEITRSEKKVFAAYESLRLWRRELLDFDAIYAETELGLSDLERQLASSPADTKTQEVIRHQEKALEVIRFHREKHVSRVITQKEQLKVENQRHVAFMDSLGDNIRKPDGYIDFRVGMEFEINEGSGSSTRRIANWFRDRGINFQKEISEGLDRDLKEGRRQDKGKGKQRDTGSKGEQEGSDKKGLDERGPGLLGGGPTETSGGSNLVRPTSDLTGPPGLDPTQGETSLSGASYPGETSSNWYQRRILYATGSADPERLETETKEEDDSLTSNVWEDVPSSSSLSRRLRTRSLPQMKLPVELLFARRRTHMPHEDPVIGPDGVPISAAEYAEWLFKVAQATDDASDIEEPPSPGSTAFPKEWRPAGVFTVIPGGDGTWGFKPSKKSSSEIELKDLSTEISESSIGGEKDKGKGKEDEVMGEGLTSAESGATAGPSEGAEKPKRPGLLATALRPRSATKPKPPAGPIYPRQMSRPASTSFLSRVFGSKDWS
ncbi:hypothetical protein ABW19_dt0210500 [Dactylella cylindrospora]|nr:hypothetical protein ABW19_dt0210500 [Dactylella cylindrospora]